jgi:4-hydroxybenzoate polyprenyltransferase
MRWQVAVAASAWLAAGVAVYLFNGSADLVEDRANGSTRPIASGRLAVRDALWLARSAAVLALAAATVAGVVVQAAIFLALGYAYSGPPWPAKRHWAAASLTITASGAVTFWAASQAAGCVSDATVVAAATLATWMGLVGAPVKDLSDVAGDRISGRKTYAVTFGPYRTGRFAAALALAVGLSGSVASAALAPFLLPAMVTLLAGGVMIAVRSGRIASPAGRHGTRTLYRIFMTAQHAAVSMIIASGVWYAFNVSCRLRRVPSQVWTVERESAPRRSSTERDREDRQQVPGAARVFGQPAHCHA